MPERRSYEGRNASSARDLEPAARRCLLLFTKPARPGRVKTRLIGALTPGEAARIHAAFLGDLSERLRDGSFHLTVAWALAAGEEFPRGLVVGEVENVRQADGALGARLYHALAAAATRFPAVAAVGSDHPELSAETVEEAFLRLESGADAVFGPVADGGYYLIGVGRRALSRELFEGIPWSTDEVLSETLGRCERLGLEVSLLPRGHDVDVAEDLRRLAARLAAKEGECPRTRALLGEWGWLDGPSGGRIESS